MNLPPRLDLKLVEDFVGSAHRNFERVKELLEQEPTLLNAAHDWGGGSWETALGAASHVGNREIAEYLLSQGSPMNICTAAMLGKLELVQTMINDNPNQHHALGAHGIPLLTHAKVGGEQAKAVLEWLESIPRII
jgi:hypothetical protein